MLSFDYSSAFARNIGWVAPHEQEILRWKRVAIAGLGGVGGRHLLTLTRLGIGAFSIADPDIFELTNFNRQAGASLSHVGRPKVDVVAELALDINPELDIRTIPGGVDENNVGEFLDGVDAYVDGLDYFAVDARRLVFAQCASRNIPAVTAAPLGMGAAVLNFLPGRMTFEEYFRLEGHPEEEQLIRFLIGLSPAMLQRRYLVHPEAVDFLQHRGPSTVMACDMCAGLAATQTLKMLLKRGKLLGAPHVLQFDGYRNKLAHSWRPGGNRNPIQQISLVVARRLLKRFRQSSASAPHSFHASTVVEQILDLARWAPSGDNIQPWRFEIVSDKEVIIHARDAADEDVYDYNDGQPSWLSFGFLLESIRVAGTRFGREMSWEHVASEDHNHTFRVVLSPSEAVKVDPLFAHLITRSVDRRRYRMSRLAQDEKRALEEAVGEDVILHWAESISERWRWAKINAMASQIRLTIPEAFDVHRRILDWDRDFSPARVPATAVGVDPLTRRLMRWVMRDWARANFMNRYLGGTLIPRIELDLLPGVFCAGHVLVESRWSDDEDSRRAAWLAAGMALQRLWLTADRLGLVMQPSLAPLAGGRCPTQ